VKVNEYVLYLQMDDLKAGLKAVSKVAMMVDLIKIAERSCSRRSETSN
jgi:hypothetical protein